MAFKHTLFAVLGVLLVGWTSASYAEVITRPILQDEAECLKKGDNVRFSRCETAEDRQWIEECKAKKGRMQVYGEKYLCYLPAKDVGKECYSSKECENKWCKIDSSQVGCKKRNGLRKVDGAGHCIELEFKSLNKPSGTCGDRGGIQGNACEPNYNEKGELTNSPCTDLY